MQFVVHKTNFPVSIAYPRSNSIYLLIKMINLYFNQSNIGRNRGNVWKLQSICIQVSARRPLAAISYLYVPHQNMRCVYLWIEFCESSPTRNCFLFTSTWVWWGSCCSSFYFSVVLLCLLVFVLCHMYTIETVSLS